MLLLIIGKGSIFYTYKNERSTIKSDCFHKNRLPPPEGAFFMVQNGSATQDIAALAEKWREKKGSLIMILHEIQNQYGYIPRDVSMKLSKLLDIPMARIYEVITFYNYFKLDPPGKYNISICLGTACYLKGAPELVEEVKTMLNIKEGQTTQDGLFHLDVVRCLGCCGLAPVMMINGEIHGKVKREEIATILSKYKKEG
jgi:NADH-quinone oxidoreductase subunit E